MARSRNQISRATKGAEVILDVPRFKCFVDKRFLTNDAETGLLEAYCFSVTLIESRPLLWTVHTIDGAVYSRLPTWAIYTRPDALVVDESQHLDTWGAISSNGQVIAHQYLKDYWAEVTLGGSKQEGLYKFTIDYFDGGFSECPEQHKTSNIIFLESGQICAVPNNYCLFKDRHFVNDEVTTKYRRNTRYYTLP